MKQLCFKKLESTQTTAREFLKVESLPYVIFAENQTHGYGKYGRPWSFRQGNFAATFVVHLPVPDALQKLPMWVGLKIVEVLKEVCPSKVDLMLKWPNDILLNAKKIGGVLIERLENAYLIGVGLNLARSPHDMKIPYSVSSIREETGVSIPPKLLLSSLSKVFSHISTLLPVVQIDVLRGAYVGMLYGLNQPVQVVNRRQKFKGILKDIQTDGAAIVSVEDKIEKIYAADIFVEEL